MKQMTFASAAWSAKGKTTRRERFLAEMDAVIPWARLVALVEPHYPKAGNGRRPMALERMLRVYFMQQWFNLSDPQAEDALYDIEPMRRFAGVELAEDAVPDETTILRFRHLLEEHRLTEAIFAEVRALLEERGLLLKSGTIVDATIINAPSSTKNAGKERDPEMHQTRKGKQWYFGMKVHVGASKRGLVHSVATGPANEADITRLDDLLHGEETVARHVVLNEDRDPVLQRALQHALQDHAAQRIALFRRLQAVRRAFEARVLKDALHADGPHPDLK